jgi:hypothetical protein
VFVEEAAEISIAGGILLARRPDNAHSPEELLHGGNHFDDFARNHLR